MNSTERMHTYVSERESFKEWLDSGKGFIVKILILVALFVPLYVIIHNIFDSSDVDEISLCALPVLFMAVYYVASKNAFFERCYEVSGKEKAVKRNLFIVSLVDALVIQGGLSFILPWYYNTTENADILTFINLYTSVVIAVNAVCMIYLAYRYIKHRELSLTSVLSVQFGVFAAAILAYDILRRVSDPAVIYNFIFVLMPYIVSVILYTVIEIYFNRKRR